jgi:hypothetical protein
MALTYSVPDAELSATLHNRRAEVIDNIFQGTPFLTAMRTMGGVRTEPGGLKLDTPVEFSKNTTVQWFTGYDQLDVTPQNNETTATYEWANLSTSISISWDEEMKNRGRHRIFSLLDQKINNAMRTARDKLNIGCTATQPAAGAKDINSITEIIDNDPTADPARTASIGGIGNANTWWRNQQTDGGAFTVADMNTMYNDCSDGADPPTFILTSQTIFEYYENSQVGQRRYENTRMADAGFESLQYKGKPIFWDPQIGITDETYFINTAYLKLTMMEGADFVTTDFVKPDNQAARTAQILAMMQLESNNRRRLGNLDNITAPA